MGIAFSCLSHVDYFKVTCVADTAVIEDPAILVRLLEENLNKFIVQAKETKENHQQQDNLSSENMTPQTRGGL